ncbi:MAG: tryptophan synthase subunit alpha [Methanomicrobiales archaeon]|nr:tryptophan synthase subunit alpha [Methanomicrobiales archaeon]MDI6875674.1 tryptophan synthase subunit alpha [Methanomicrobiales archaeon]
MNRIDRVFESLNRPAFIAFLVGGDPDREGCVQAAKSLIDGGADILELGIPFSDPVADGPTIQRADLRALQGGANPAMVLDIVREIRDCSDLPVVLLTYGNIVHRRGVERFYREAAASGADGVLIVDMPHEECRDVLETAERYGMRQIFLVAPTTSEERMGRILASAGGFVYLVSRLGTTGGREQLSDDTLEMIGRIRPRTALPLAVGFGISRAEHIRACAAAGVDAVIVGSAIVDIVEATLHDRTAMQKELRDYVREMTETAKACAGTRRPER